MTNDVVLLVALTFWVGLGLAALEAAYVLLVEKPTTTLASRRWKLGVILAFGLFANTWWNVIEHLWEQLQ